MEALHMYILFPCIKHFTTYHLCWESLKTMVDRKKNKGRVRKPTETEALPPRVDKRKLYVLALNTWRKPKRRICLHMKSQLQARG